MKLKSIVTITLLVFVVASVVYVVADSFHTRVKGADEKGGAARRVIVYYFHGEYRCPTCRAIEQYAHEALKTGFPEALQSGALEWRAVNVEDPEHQHFIDDYQLSTKSLILAEMDGENQVRWKNLDQIWVLVSNKFAFISYVQEEIRAYLEEN